jgi:hypothetical protein
VRLSIQSGNAYGDRSNGIESPYDSIYRDFNYPTYFRPGMGDTSTTSIAAVAATGAAQTGSILSTLGKSFGTDANGDTNLLGTIGSFAGPIGAAISGLTSIAIAIASLFKGCGTTCTQASNIANQIEAQLLQNLNTYMSAPIHYASMQAAALNTFDTTWAALQQACGQAALQQAGVNCVSDRQQGACKWKAQAGGWTQAADGSWSYAPWGASGSGSTCWNWWVGYRDPIANDPTVVPDPAPATASSTSTGTADSTSTSTLDSLLPASLTGSVQIGSVSIPIIGLLGGAVLLIALSR